MENTEMNRKGLLFRIVIPAFKEINIFSRIAKTTSALGPIMVATEWKWCQLWFSSWPRRVDGGVKNRPNSP